MNIDSYSPIPVYIQIEQLIEQLVLKQELSAHELVPSVAVLARQLKVAPLTVQRAYRRLQERGLIYSIAGKGSFVADAADQQFVGVLVHSEFMLDAAQAPTQAILVRAICEYLAERRIPVRILTDTNPHRPTAAPISADVMSTIEHGRPIGMILMGHYGSEPLFQLTRERSIPVIGFHINCPQADARLVFDHLGMLRTALSYLRDRKIDEAAILWLDHELSPGERLDYLTKIEQVIVACGLKPNRDWIIGVHQARDWAGYHAFNHLCSLPRRPQGLIVLDDVIARGVHTAVLARQLRVPEDITIVVQTNEDSPIVFPQQWQQCGYNLADCGRIAVETLHTLLNGGKPAAADMNFPFKWHGETTRSPWDAPNLSIRSSGALAPVFRTGRQVLETTI